MSRHRIHRSNVRVRVPIARSRATSISSHFSPSECFPCTIHGPASSTGRWKLPHENQARPSSPQTVPLRGRLVFFGRFAIFRIFLPGRAHSAGQERFLLSRFAPPQPENQRLPRSRGPATSSRASMSAVPRVACAVVFQSRGEARACRSGWHVSFWSLLPSARQDRFC